MSINAEVVKKMRNFISEFRAEPNVLLIDPRNYKRLIDEVRVCPSFHVNVYMGLQVVLTRDPGICVALAGEKSE